MIDEMTLPIKRMMKDNKTIEDCNDALAGFYMFYFIHITI